MILASAKRTHNLPKCVRTASCVSLVSRELTPLLELSIRRVSTSTWANIVPVASTMAKNRWFITFLPPEQLDCWLLFFDQRCHRNMGPVDIVEVENHALHVLKLKELRFRVRIVLIDLRVLSHRL